MKMAVELLCFSWHTAINCVDVLVFQVSVFPWVA